jgi:O-glycosyl hydrolase
MFSSFCRVSIIIISISVFDVFSLTVAIDPEITYQTFDGWGTSLCWWANSAGGWDEEKYMALVGAIVDPDTGLGYTCFRYNIGGGDNPSHTHMSNERAIPGFKPTENGDYDWSADERQRNILLGIAERIDNPVFEAFSNSPPWWMTISGCASGNDNGADNLKPAYFTAFADYLATVVKHYKDTYDITFSTVEPFNEPSSGYWKPNGGQEGCGFKYKQSEMIVELGKKLTEKELFPETSVSAADETSLEHTVTSVESYSDEALTYLSQISSHSYGGWNYRDDVFDLSQKLGKKLWQSESGPLGKNDNSDIAMWMSDVIIQDLRQMKPNVWIDWQVCDPHPDWRSIEIDNTRQRFTYNKRYYMHTAFSRFIRPGAQFIFSSESNSVAALVPETGNLVVVLRNSSSQRTDYTIDLSKFSSHTDTARIYRFELPGSLSRKDDPVITGDKLSFSAPGQTLTTCVIPGMVTTATGQRFITAKQSGLVITIRKGRLYVAINGQLPKRITMYSCNGRRVLSFNRVVSSSGGGIELSGYRLANGLYSIELLYGNKRNFGKIIYHR